MELPTLVARDLTGRRLRLPAELEGRLNVLLLFRAREGEQEARNWVPYIKQMEQAHGALWHYLAPIPGRGGVLWRMLARARWRGRVQDAAERRRVLLLRTTRSVLAQALGMSPEQELEVYMVDRSGRVFWHEAGHVTPQKVRSLAESVEAARTRATA